VRFPITIPTGATALRPRWADLPADVRARVEGQLGAGVTASLSQGSGFTPGFASVLELSDGRRVFVKAASDAQPWLVTAYREEVRKVVLLPDGLPAPRLQSVIEEELAGHQWLIMIFDAIEGAPPARPWREDQAVQALVAVHDLADGLTPAPVGVELPTAAAELRALAPSWGLLPDRAEWQPYLTDIRGLIDQTERLVVGDTLVHLDLRDDNVIIDTAGRAWVCDWNFPAVGARWIDLICLLISMRGDGLDADAMLARSRLCGPGDDQGIDCLLAHLTGYCIASAEQPGIETSPWLRAHQRWYAQVTGDWLCARRGWQIASPR
jgi:Phosphotransferase enzyme family